MKRTMTATEARVHFGELMRRVAEHDETVVVERGGKPQVVVISLAEYDRLRGEQEPEEDWWELAARSRRLIDEFRQGRPLPDIDELIHEIREERDAQLLDALR
jgi:prevent-host-death family protein